MTAFEALHLSESILRAIAEAGYDNPTPIQAQAIPKVLMGRDLIGLAQTGTGKTASFILPMIDILREGRARSRMPRSLILTPTRELAMQIAENFDAYGRFTPLTKALLIGGTSFSEQEAKLKKGVDVLIATPGRLIDHFENGKVLLNDIKVFVVDEADRMLDMGFIPDIEKIASKLPQDRQTLLFSATMPKPVKGLAEKFLNNPAEVAVARVSSTSDSVEQFSVKAPGDPKKRRDLLVDLMKKLQPKNSIVFCNRKKDIDAIERHLNKSRFKAVAFHGDMTQSHRIRTINTFKAGEADILVASDVAARGLDIDALSMVFNFEVPNSYDDYVHRIGRTGRAGAKGKAFTIHGSAERRQYDALKKSLGEKLKEFRVSNSAEQSQELKKKADVAKYPEPKKQQTQEVKPVNETQEKGFGSAVPSFFQTS